MAENNTEISTDLEKKIIRQIEYYFGDVNLPKDKFLKEKVKEDDGWITIECLTTFNKLKALSTDFEEISKALKKSDSGLLEINEEEFKVRRSKDKPLPDLDDPLVVKAKKMKTIYMKGFPTTYTMDQVTEFLKSNNAVPIFIKMRKTDRDMEFKGSIFTELETQEQADSLLENKELKIDDEELMLVMKRDDYFDMKQKERRANRGDREDQPPRPKIERKDGVVMHFKNVEEGLPREELKDLFGPHQSIAWVDFNKGDTQGFLRFEEAGAAQKAIDAIKEANDGKIMLKEKELECRVIEGEELEKYWKMTEEEMAKRKSGGGRNNGRGGGRGGRGGYNKKRQQNNRYGNRKRSRDNRDNNDSRDNNTSQETENPKGEHVRFDGDADGGSDAKKVKSEVKAEVKTEE